MPAKKNYYKILNVKPAATSSEIKNAYRRLAFKYHPDHNPDDELSANVFTELAEAYSVLSDIEARNKYNYDRFITAEQEYKRPSETVETLNMRTQELNRYLETADPFRFNKEALLYSIKQLLPEEVSSLLHSNKEQVNQFLQSVVFATGYLSSHQTKQLLLLFQPLFKEHDWLQRRLTSQMRQQQKQERWEKYKIVLAVIIAVIICIVIFFTAKK